MLKDDRRKNRLTPHVSRLTSSTAGPGDPAAHRTDRLPLLPSGPGGVHRVLSHRAQPLVHIQHSLKARDTCGVSPPSINLETPKRAGGSHEVRYGGEGGIRTHGRVTPTHAFQACRFGHSRTSPRPGQSKRRHLNMGSHERQGEQGLFRLIQQGICRVGGV